MFELKDYRTTRIPNFFEFIRVACPICGHAGGCMINGKGDRVACIRIESERPFSQNSSLPSWLHFLRGEKIQKVNLKSVEEQGHTKLPEPKLDLIYSAMMDHLELSDDHYNHLTSPTRGLNDEQIMRRGYVSFPNKPWSLAKLIQHDLDIEDFAGVPGFFKATNTKGGTYWSISGREGILIPYRDTENRVIGFQYRVDNPAPIAKVKKMSGVHGLKARNKDNLVTVYLDEEVILEKEMQIGEEHALQTSEGKVLGFVSLQKGIRYYWLSSANKKDGTGVGSPNPVHISVPSVDLDKWEKGSSIKRKVVWLTEGALKGDIAADMANQLFTKEQLAQYGNTFINIPGANSWQTVIPTLKKMEVEEINLALDRDFSSNPYVMKALKDFMAYAKKESYHVNMVSWAKEDGKGIDDLFLSRGKIPTVTRIF